MDVDAIPAGRNFRQHLETAVARCDAVVAVIGERWLDARDETGQRRLDLPNDWVRIELEAALARGVPVIPLLVDGAPLPSAERLPKPLAELAYRQALHVRPGRDFQHDVEVLRSEIERTCRTGDGGALRPPAWWRGGRSVAAVVLLALVGLAAWLAERGGGPAPKTVPATTLAPAATTPVPERPVGAIVDVPAGLFFMGCNENVDDECDEEEKPGRTVTVGAFRIDRTEVTVAQYAACVRAGACSADGLTMPSLDGQERPKRARFCAWGKSGREAHPINCLTWAQAVAYCAWAGKRLPTEEEWEKAARGTDGRKYPWGSTGYATVGKAVANVAAAPAGSFPAGASPYGAQDMIGNVAEWTATERAGGRVVRGGSWRCGPREARASSRSWRDSEDRDGRVGVRCAQ